MDLDYDYMHTMTNEKELVSVGIPAYNKPDGLRRALECLTSQTFDNLEIIISNDCSPDPRTETVALEFAEKDARIKYFYQEENKGRFFNFGFVLEKAAGEYFMWASDDDEWDTRFVEVCVSKLNDLPDYGLVFTKYDFTSPNDEKIINLNHNRYLKAKYKRAIFLLLDECLTHKANMSYGVWRRETISRVMERAISSGLSERHMGQGFDQAFLLLALDETNVYQIQENLFTKRYLDRLIPGSRRAILRSTARNFRRVARKPIPYAREVAVGSRQYMEVVKQVYSGSDRKRTSILFFAKRILYILRRYVF